MLQKDTLEHCLPAGEARTGTQTNTVFPRIAARCNSEAQGQSSLIQAEGGQQSAQDKPAPPTSLQIRPDTIQKYHTLAKAPSR